MSVETVNEAHSLDVQQGLGAGTSTPCAFVLTACCEHKKPEAKIANLPFGVFCEWYLLLQWVLGSSSGRSRSVDGMRAREEKQPPRCSFTTETCSTHGLQKGQSCAAWRTCSVQVASVSASRRASRARLIPGRLTRARALRGSCVGRAQGPRPRCVAEPPWRVVEKNDFF
jgi:hypothetical protein